MEHEIGEERDTVALPRFRGQIVKRDASRDVAQVEREQRRRERAQDAFPQRQDRRAWPPNVQRHCPVPQRGEEPQTFEMVEMKVRQEQVNPPCPAFEEVAAKFPDPRAGVEHERLLVSHHHLDARGVSAKLDRRWARSWQRASTSPDLHAHRHHCSPRQKITTMPTNSSVRANSGKAVDSISRSTPSALVTRYRRWEARRSSNAIRAGRRSGGSGADVSVRGSNAADPVIQRRLPRFREAPTDNRLRRLVVEDETPTRVGDQRRRGQA